MHNQKSVVCKKQSPKKAFQKSIFNTIEAWFIMGLIVIVTTVILFVWLIGWKNVMVLAVCLVLLLGGLCIFFKIREKQEALYELEQRHREGEKYDGHH